MDVSQAFIPSPFLDARTVRGLRALIRTHRFRRHSTGRLPIPMQGDSSRLDLRLNFAAFAKPMNRSGVGLSDSNIFRTVIDVGHESLKALFSEEQFVATGFRLNPKAVRLAPLSAIVNVMLPGQCLPVHTDIPEFVCAPRTVAPAWLTAAMARSQLFEDERIPIVTATWWLFSGRGGELELLDGAEKVCLSAVSNAGVVFDADRIRHGVVRVAGDTNWLRPRTGRHLELWPDDYGTWGLIDPTTGARQFEFSSDAVRLSLSWKAMCLGPGTRHVSNDAPTWDRVSVLNRFREDLKLRYEVANAHSLDDRELGLLIVKNYVRA